LGEIQPDLADALGVDVVGLLAPRTKFGYLRENWNRGPFSMVPRCWSRRLQHRARSGCSILQYPEGDRSVPASGIMPHGGYYFDAIIRQPPIDEAKLDPRITCKNSFPSPAADLDYFEQEAARLYHQTDRAILANFGGTAFGDIGLVPVPGIKHPRGIRDVAEWYMSTATGRLHLQSLRGQCAIALANLEKIYGVVGSQVTAIFTTALILGAQNGPFISPKTYRELFMPFHKQVNQWIHGHTPGNR